MSPEVPAPDPAVLSETLRRLRARALDAPALDPLDPIDPRDDDPEPSARATLDYEMAPRAWVPRWGMTDCAEAPHRFIDGSFRPQLVMSLEDSRGRLRPVILATVGAVALDLGPAGPLGAQLSRVASRTDTVLAFLANGLDPRDVAVITRAAGAVGLRTVAPQAAAIASAFDEVRHSTLTYVRREMLKLEADLLRAHPDVPTVVDGLLDQRIQDFTSHDLPAVGVVKRQLRTYLHLPGVRLVYALRPGERSPAFLLDTSHGQFVSFYLRLSEDGTALPHGGVVRVMVSRQHFEAHGASWARLDGLAHWLRELRCRRTSYARANVSLEPIVRAEEHIRALLPDLGERIGRFNHAMALPAWAGRGRAA